MKTFDGTQPRPDLDQAALRAACALEMVHAYSLVHDDMPCMDNDVLRRGLPTVHVKFGESMALLCGDALQTLAFEVITPEPQEVGESIQARLCRLLSRAAGLQGMCGGQAIDLTSVGVQLTQVQLELMHAKKTGALLRASVLMGAACSNLNEREWQHCAQFLTAYAEKIGLAFQVIDDVLDVVSDAKTLGKTPGKDALNDKPNFVALLGLEGAQNYAMGLYEEALAQLSLSGLKHTQPLIALASLVVHRKS
jgi:farnesyl diphosphate synthase